MPFITKSQIPPDVRKKHTDAYRDSLRQQLLNPALTQQQRVSVKETITMLSSAVSPVADSGRQS